MFTVHEAGAAAIDGFDAAVRMIDVVRKPPEPARVCPIRYDGAFRPMPQPVLALRRASDYRDRDRQRSIVGDPDLHDASKREPLLRPIRTGG